MTVRARSRSTDVFINCPFDDTYKPIFEAIVFAVYDLGFVARCALEVDDSGEARLTKITRIIEQCPYGIHDISSVGLGTSTSFLVSICLWNWVCIWGADSMVIKRRKQRHV